MTKIIPAKEKNAFYINGTYVLAKNWQVSKSHFNSTEQKDFETQVLNNPNALDVEFETVEP